MDRDELQQVQGPLKESYREDPEAAVVTLRASGSLGEGISCSVATGRAMAEAGLHPASGGDGTLLCSGDMLLEALAACAGVTLRAVSTSIDVPVRGGRVECGGRPRLPRDARGREGRAGGLPRDPRALRCSTPTRSDEQLDTLLRLTERYCVVLQTIVHAPEVSISR